MITREQLPNDTFELKGIVCQLLDVVEEQRTLIANLNQRVEVQLSKNEEQYQHIAAQSQQIATQSQQIITQSQQMEVQSQKIEEQSQRIDQLTDQVNVLTRYKFGKRSEKVKEEKPKPSNEEGSQDGYFPPLSIQLHIKKNVRKHILLVGLILIIIGNSCNIWGIYINYPLHSSCP